MMSDNNGESGGAIASRLQPNAASKLKLTVARGWKAWVLRELGLAAVTMPWQTIYVLPRHLENASLIRHEAVHAWQIDRDGAWKFALLYAWWLLTRGYAANPYEIEAYELAPIEPTPWCPLCGASKAECPQCQAWPR